MSQVLNMRERCVNMTRVINALIQHDQVSIIAKGNHEFFFSFLFLQNSKSRYKSENSKTSQDQSCSVLPNDQRKVGGGRESGKQAKVRHW